MCGVWGCVGVGWVGVWCVCVCFNGHLRGACQQVPPMDGVIYPPIFDQSGGPCNHTTCEKFTIFWLLFPLYSVEISKFCFCFLVMLAILYIKFLQTAKCWSIRHRDEKFLVFCFVLFCFVLFFFVLVCLYFVVISYSLPLLNLRRKVFTDQIAWFQLQKIRWSAQLVLSRHHINLLLLLPCTPMSQTADEKTSFLICFFLSNTAATNKY